MDNATSSLADASAEWIGPPARLPSAWRRENLSFVALSAGQSYTCARTGTVRAYCWETSHTGELGDSTGTRLAPTEVPQSATGFIFAGHWQRARMRHHVRWRASLLGEGLNALRLADAPLPDHPSLRPSVHSSYRPPKQTRLASARQPISSRTGGKLFRGTP